MTTNIKDICIREFLQTIGVAPAYERQHYGMYLSPLRPERNASFRVDYTKNLWYDHGSGEGGSVVDLVMHLRRCTFREAAAYLRDKNFDIALPVHQPASPPAGIRITAVLPIQSRALVEYLKERAIPLYIAQKYCREVRYTVNGGREFYSIGFLNDGGGWELRNRKYKASSSPKTITTIETGHYRCLVFEGFFDFLSWYRMQRELPMPDNIVVLNSVVNVGKAVEFIKKFDTVCAFMDRDQAGRNALKFLKSVHPNVNDQSYFYAESNDVNEQLVRYDREIGELDETTKREILSGILAGLIKKNEEE